MKKNRETASKYRQQALEGDLMAMNNMGMCYAQGKGQWLRSSFSRIRHFATSYFSG